ncbi:hypothetical protein E2C01_099879 [Portunus trituberculatus]|uniref:Uncharacterized protein n=1 Tax=Portunus trituberculatus TaxID=210409 RepID=A0A5B7KHZ0_PORTR|nr:hypothetical protein [Portunus trituberculatus]
MGCSSCLLNLKASRLTNNEYSADSIRKTPRRHFHLPRCHTQTNLDALTSAQRSSRLSGSAALAVSPFFVACENVFYSRLLNVWICMLPDLLRFRGRRGTVEPCVLWGPRGLQAHGFESCPRSGCRLGFLTQGNGFLAGGLSDKSYPNKVSSLAHKFP